MLTVNSKCPVAMCNASRSPLRPQFAYCGTFGSGLWRSGDAGDTWKPAGEGITHARVLSVAVSRVERVKDLGVVYVGSEPTAIFVLRTRESLGRSAKA